MATAFESETWCSTLWSEAKNAFEEKLLQSMIQHASRQFPNECIGFVVATKGGIECIPFDAFATPTTVDLAPGEVIQIAYHLALESRQVVATYHSHPNGSVRPSRRDDALSLWSSRMVLLVYHNEWQVHVFEWLS